MLNKVHPKLWWTVLAVVVVLLISWGLVRKNKTEKERVEIAAKVAAISVM